MLCLDKVILFEKNKYVRVLNVNNPQRLIKMSNKVKKLH